MSAIAPPLTALLALLLAACSSAPQAPQSAEVPTTENATPPAESATAPEPGVPRHCDASKAQWAIGKAANQDTVDKAIADSGSRTARVIRPGQPVTMDFREDRLNLEVDAGDVVTTVRCG
jgi:hypothetical protein